MVKFGATGAAVLAEELENLVANGALRSWSPRAFLEFTRKRALHVVSTGGYPWIELIFPRICSVPAMKFCPKFLRFNSSGCFPSPRCIPQQIRLWNSAGMKPRPWIRWGRSLDSRWQRFRNLSNALC